MASVFQKWFPQGFRLIDGGKLNSWFNIPKKSFQTGIVATAGGTKAAAYQLQAAVNRVVTCATNGDSVMLPASSDKVGGSILIINDGAANLQVFGHGTDTIDDVVTGTGVTLTAARRALFWATADGKWSSGYMLKSA